MLDRRLFGRCSAELDEAPGPVVEPYGGEEDPLGEPRRGRPPAVAQKQNEIRSVAALGEGAGHPTGALDGAKLSTSALPGHRIEYPTRPLGEGHGRAQTGQIGLEAGQERQAGGSEQLGRTHERRLELDRLAAKARPEIVGKRASEGFDRPRAAFARNREPVAFDRDLEIVAQKGAERADDLALDPSRLRTAHSPLSARAHPGRSGLSASGRATERSVRVSRSSPSPACRT